MTQPEPPRVSVITATYDRPEVLRWAMEAVRGQTLASWEHIIVGDGCGEETGALVRACDDPRVRYVNLERNWGEQSVPNNAGLAIARGAFIAYLNHDDLWFPDHLESLLAHLEANRAELVYALPLNIDADGVPWCGVTNTEMQYDPSHFIPASLWLCRRELLDELGGWRTWKETDASNPSQDLLFRAWQRGRKLICHPRFTAIILASGGRPGCYVTHDDTQHRALLQRINQPGAREEIATRLAIAHGREQKASAAIRAFDGVATLLGQQPGSLRNRLMLRRRGWWINVLRRLRGLPPLRADQ